MDYCVFLLTLYLFRQKNTSIPNQLNMELALFMDSAAYSILTEVLDHQELVDVTFSVINQVRPSLYYVSKKNDRMGGVGRWPQGRNHGENLGSTSAMVGKICPPWLG